MNKLSAQEHLEAAQNIEDTLSSGKLDDSTDIADAIAEYDEHLRRAACLVAHYVRMMKD